MIDNERQVTAERDRDKDYYYKEYRRESGDERMAKVTLNICSLWDTDLIPIFRSGNVKENAIARRGREKGSETERGREAGAGESETGSRRLQGGGAGTSWTPLPRCTTG